MTLITFNLPKTGKWKVNQGDKVLAGQVIAEIKIEGEEKFIPLPKLLGVSPRKVGKFLLKKVGDKVSGGEPLAQKKTLFKKIAVLSPCAGKLVKIEKTGGELIIEEEGGWQELICDVSGKVLKLSEEACEIEFEGEVLLGIKGAGKKVTGEINYLGDKMGISNLTKENKGKIVVAKEVESAALEKSLALEVAGAVLTDISGENFAKICQGKTWEIGESCLLSLPFLVVSETDFGRLKNFQGKKAVLDPEQKRLILCL